MSVLRYFLTNFRLKILATITCINIKQRLTNTPHQELVKKKEKYTGRFELNDFVYSEEEYPCI